ncbi:MULTISPECIES: hypothetical protein [Stenotrophomonas maltophilia group]|uniref:hypothetical protein n=1 Tax=Stenotrophomonas maltophilia group TaxID=995085 RepID=UPI000F685706|nr:hypothetical protein [Stenotrophomonas maltophilia]
MNASSIRRKFAVDRFARLEQLVAAEVMDLYFQYAKSYARMPNYYELETETVSLGRYADAMGEVLLAKLLPEVEDCVGKRLHATYSFLRFYTPESRLRRHTDRTSCEYTLTLTVGSEGTRAPWPIMIETQEGVQAFDLAPGDGLLFSGRELPHWRECLPVGTWLQLFLHYVDADGPHAANRFDGRKFLGPTRRSVA